MNIIITGTGKGIGFETAKLLSASKGNKVIAVSRNTEKLQKLANEIPGGKNGSYLYPLALDLSKKGFEKTLLTYILDRFSKIDILINNAGNLVNKTISQHTSDDFDQLFSVNVKAPFLITKTLIPHFNKPAHVINIGSMGGFQGSVKFPGLSLYSASKGALAILTECFAEELKDKAISVNCLALGSVSTEMLEQAFPGYKAPVNTNEMANFIVNFALNGNKLMNGKIIPVSLSTP
jgi:NAD(P)-dependent dehydrogenase (short-subunit alcohol dehydrogenase family)